MVPVCWIWCFKRESRIFTGKSQQKLRETIATTLATQCLYNRSETNHPRVNKDHVCWLIQRTVYTPPPAKNSRSPRSMATRMSCRSFKLHNSIKLPMYKIALSIRLWKICHPQNGAMSRLHVTKQAFTEIHSQSLLPPQEFTVHNC